MKSVLFAVAVLLLSTTAARADSGSASGSCSGRIPNYGYFFAYAYQYAYVYENSVESESHSFSFSGFLAGHENARILGVRGRHIIYRGARFDLAVPYHRGAGLFIRDRSLPPGPDPADEWIRVCSY